MSKNLKDNLNKDFFKDLKTYVNKLVRSFRKNYEDIKKSITNKSKINDEVKWGIIGGFLTFLIITPISIIIAFLVFIFILIISLSDIL